MRTSNNGLAIIKKHESLRLKPYLCPAGVPTIGYGNTYYGNGLRVKLSDPAITNCEAESLLEASLKHYEQGVDRYVRVSITQNQFDALVSFAYNVGLGSLQKSTLLKRINANPNDPNIRYQFSRWKRANGRVLKGLIKRRKEESELYFK